MSCRPAGCEATRKSTAVEAFAACAAWHRAPSGAVLAGQRDAAPDCALLLLGRCRQDRFADTAEIRESSREFAKSSREFATNTRKFAARYSEVRKSSQEVRESSQEVRKKFARSSQEFAKIRESSRMVREFARN